MKKKMNKVVSTLMVVAILMASLVGCGGNNSAENDNAESTGTDTTENAATEETEVSENSYAAYDAIDAASLAGTTVNVYTHMGQRVLGEEKKDADGNTYRDESTAILAQLAEEFEAKYDIHVEFTIISNEDELKPLFQVGDSSVDIYTSPTWTIEEWQQYAEPYFPMEDGIKLYGDYAKTMYNDGTNIYALSPAKTYDNCVVYNEEAIKAVGYDAIPATLEEFEIMCQKLREAGTTPISLHRVENWPLDSFKAFASYVAGNNTAFPEMLKSDNPFSADEPIGQTIRMYTQWKANGFFEPEIYTDFGVAMDSVAYGDAAMMLFGSWVVPQIQGRVPEGKDPSSIKFAPAPDFGNGRYVTSSAADSYAISKFSENKDAARLFIEYLASDAQYIADSGFIANKAGVEPIVPALYSIIDEMVASGEAQVIYSAPTSENSINNEEVLTEANLLADVKWAGNLFDTLDVTKPEDWTAYDAQVEAQNKAYAESKADLGISWID
ncbi:MAG: ABC transporter substrate-binding protein [Mobilitalea sp.]